MAKKVTQRQRKSFEAKIGGAGRVEIKITVRDNEKAHAYETLDIKNRDAHKRLIYFFDTPKLDLYKGGLILRARHIEGDNHDSGVKIRPINPRVVSKKWLGTDGFKIEADTVGGKVIMSASLKHPQKDGKIEKVSKGKRPISRLFSKKQNKFLARFHEEPVDLDRLSILGPVPTLRADIDRPGIDYELTAELWKLPDKTELLELSIKCRPEESIVAREVFHAFLAGHGLDPNGAQVTKTKRALDCFAKRLKKKGDKG